MAADEVLIITASMIGDTILTTGAVDAIFDRHRGSRFTIVSSPLASTLFHHVPVEAEVIGLAKRRYGRHWIALWRRLRGRRWAAIYDFRDSVMSRLLRGPRRAPRKASDPTHKVVEASTILTSRSQVPAPRLWLANDASGLPSSIETAQRLLVLGPGASRQGKAWPADRFGELATRLIGLGGPLSDAVVVVVGGAVDKPVAEVIRRAVRSDRVVDLTGADLLTTGALLARATLFVGNDSGMMHLAAASGCPTLGLFGPTDERLYGPWGPGRTLSVRPADVAFRFGKTSRTVSTTESQMLALEPMAVIEAAQRLLAETATP